MLDKLKGWLSGPSEEVILARQQKNGDAMSLPSDAGRPMRIGFLVLGLGLGGFLLWSVTAPIDEGVPAPGQVAFDSKRKTVQHLTGGVVAEVLVSEGQSVKEGEVLMRLRDATSRANYEGTLHTFYSLAAARARLTAEQAGAGSVKFPPELAKDSHPLAQTHKSAQTQLFNARRSALASDLAVFAEGSSAAESTARSLESQLTFMKDELKGMRDLAAQGYAPRNQQLSLERQYSELSSSARRARSQATELRLRSVQRQQEFRREVESQLAEVTRELAVTEQRLDAAQEELDRTVVKAPIEGQVIGLATQMAGAVITPGQRLLDVVPKEEALVIEVHVAPHLIDRVHVGQHADVNFHTFVNQPEMTLTGEVVSLAGDVLVEQGPAGANPYYLARVVVTPEGVKKLGNNRMQSGMPADVVIKTGERTFLTYLLRPLLRRLNSSLKES